MNFDFGEFFEKVGDNLGVGSTEALAGIASRNIIDGLARTKSSASQQGSNPPVVTPTVYALDQAGNAEVFGLSITADQMKLVKLAMLALGGLLIFKLMRRR